MRCHDASGAIPKLAYTVPFTPWNWAIGTGIYIDDVNAIFRRVVLEFAAVAGGLAGVCWAKLAVAKRMEHAAVARERRNIGESLFLGGVSVRDLQNA